MRRSAGVVALLALLLAVGCSGGEPSHAEPRPPTGGAQPNGLLIITLDTTRADRLGAYGHDGARTPAIDALAREGVLFEQALSPTPLTVPAHASLFTGQLPLHHGARTNDLVLLDEPNVTLAETLSHHGFRTAAFIGAAVLRDWAGLDQGFETYADDFPYGSSPFELHIAEKRGEAVAAPAADWLAGVGNAPFFAWVHLFDPHGPYEPPGELAREFADRPYDGEIAYADVQIGALLAALERLGLADRTLVVLTADHGEGLGQHGEVAHGFFLYDATLHVPLIFNAPAVLPRGLRVEGQVSLVDVVPTVLEILGVEPPVPTAGQSLLSLARGEDVEGRAIYAETIYPRLAHGWSPLAALRRDGFKVVRAPEPELYDLTADPDELDNLFDARPELGRGMLAELDALEQRMTRELDAGLEAVDPARLKALESLGYVGGAAAVAANEADLPDPKARIATLHRLGDARRLLNSRRPQEALALLLELVEGEPDSPQIWELLGSTRLALNQMAEAEQAYGRLVEIEPDNARGLMNLGLMAISRQELDQATELLERALSASPLDPVILLNLGQLQLRLLGNDEGRAHLERFLELSPQDPAAPDVRRMLADRTP